MSPNKHTENVIFQMMTDAIPLEGEVLHDDINIRYKSAVGTAESLMSVAQLLYDVMYNKQNFRDELRKGVRSFIDYLNMFQFSDELELVVDKITDAIIKDMGIETEAKESDA